MGGFQLRKYGFEEWTQPATEVSKVISNTAIKFINKDVSRFMC